jgi:lipoate-protein ligase A
MAVICIQQKNTDPYFNLAAEEYLLKNFTEDVFMLWQSDSAVVVGKHQNALAEINHRYVAENGIKVARRLSGGGTVFHDPGNLNFTFIKSMEEIDQINFKLFTKPIVEVLQKLGLDAYSSGRNDLLLAGKKISGNAEHVYKKRVLHHGTLLYNSQLQKLKNALKVDLSRFEDKAVQSNRSEVVNMADFLDYPMAMQEFSDYIFEGVKANFTAANVFQFSEEEKRAILQLRDEKYITWDWVYGYSPKYLFKDQIENGDYRVSFSLQVVKGKIESSEFNGSLSPKQSELLANTLLGSRHDYVEIEQRLKKIEAALAPISVDMLLKMLI